MSTQIGLVVDERGYLDLRHDLVRPKPGPKQVLVKSLYVGISQLDLKMTSNDLLHDGLPPLAGSDFSGVVLETGPDCDRLTPGDYVFGMCLLRRNLYSPFQQTFLVDENLAFKKSERISTPVATSLGISVLVAALGVVVGGHLELPEWPLAAPTRREWVVILGYEGLVGTFAVQIARLCGYSVAVACPLTMVPDALRCGAEVTFDNRSPPHRQLSDLKSHIWPARIRLVFDAAVVPRDTPLWFFHQALSSVNGVKPLRVPSEDGWNGAAASSSYTSPCASPTTSSSYSLDPAISHAIADLTQPKSPSSPMSVAPLGNSELYTTYFSAIDMGTSHKVKDVLANLPSADTYIVRADLLGSNDEQGIKVTTDAATLIPILETHIDKRCITPGPCDLFNRTGWEALMNAFAIYQESPPKANVVIRVQH